MTLHATVELDRPTTVTFDTWWLVAVGSVIVSVMLASIFSPNDLGIRAGASAAGAVDPLDLGCSGHRVPVVRPT